MLPTEPMGQLCLNKTGVRELPKALGFLSFAHVLYVSGLTRQREKVHFNAIWDERLIHTLPEPITTISQQDGYAIICGEFFPPDRFSASFQYLA